MAAHSDKGSTYRLLVSVVKELTVFDGAWRLLSAKSVSTHAAALRL